VVLGGDSDGFGCFSNATLLQLLPEALAALLMLRWIGGRGGCQLQRLLHLHLQLRL
jgi:hypothetical protein